MRRVNFKVDRLPIDALVVSCYPGCLGLDFTLNLGEVINSPPWNVKKFSPFLLTCYAGRRMWDVYFVMLGLVFAVAWEVDEL